MSKTSTGLISLLSRRRNNNQFKASNKSPRAVSKDDVIVSRKDVKNNHLYQVIEGGDSNPIYNMIKNNKDFQKREDEYYKKKENKRYKDLATVSGLTNVIKTIGRGISAASGAKVADINRDVFNEANEYVKKLYEIEDDEEIDDKNKAIKKALKNGLKTVVENRENSQKKDSKKSTDVYNFSTSLKKSRKQIERDVDIDKDDANKKIEAENKRVRTLMEKTRAQNYNFLQEQLEKNYKKEQKYIDEAKKNSPKIVTYVKRDNKSIPIYEDTMTDIYRLASYDNLLEPYYSEKDAKGRAYQISIAADRLFDMYGVDEVLSGKAVQEKKKTNNPYSFMGNANSLKY